MKGSTLTFFDTSLRNPDFASGVSHLATPVSPSRISRSSGFVPPPYLLARHLRDAGIHAARHPRRPLALTTPHWRPVVSIQPRPITRSGGLNCSDKLLCPERRERSGGNLQARRRPVEGGAGLRSDTIPDAISGSWRHLSSIYTYMFIIYGYICMWIAIFKWFVGISVLGRINE